MRLSPKEAMQMAIAEGQRGFGFVSPNPLVGCVILDRDGEFLAKGYHARLGEAHAEIAALNAVTDKQRLTGAHVYVTLEPCAHQGRTPSCAKTLAPLPIASVTYGLVDPDPRVSGQGGEILRQAGKKVEIFGELQDELEDLAEIFLTNQRLKRPFVAMKVASSLDGKIARAKGGDRWITGEASRTHVQFLRGGYDAVLIGAGTFLSDNPRLNARDPRFQGRRERVVLVDPSGRCLSQLQTSNLLKVRAPADITIVTKPGVKPPSDFEHLEIPLGLEGFSIPQLLEKLFMKDIYSLFIEGGAVTYSHFLGANLVDRLYLFQAPMILGEGLGWSANLHPSPGAAVPGLQRVHRESFGEDVFMTGRFLQV